MANPFYPAPPLPTDDSSSEGSQRLQQWLATPGSAAPEYSAAERLGYGAMTALPKAIEGLSESVGNIADYVQGQPRQDHSFLPPEAYLPRGVTLPQQGADLVAGVLPIAGEIAATGMVGRGLSAATQLSRIPLAARAVTGALEFGTVGASENTTVGAEQAAEGGAMGLITGLLPKMSLGRIAAAGALGLGSKLFFDAQDPAAAAQPGPTRGDYSGLIQGLATTFIGKPIENPFKFSGLPGEIPTKAPPIVGGEFGAPNAPAFDRSGAVVTNPGKVTVAGPPPRPLPPLAPVAKPPITYSSVPLQGPEPQPYRPVPEAPFVPPQVYPAPPQFNTGLGVALDRPAVVPEIPEPAPQPPITYSTAPLMRPEPNPVRLSTNPMAPPITAPAPVLNTGLGVMLDRPARVPEIPEPAPVAPITYSSKPLMGAAAAPGWHQEAAAVGSVYQGIDHNGMHAFKELTSGSGGNFSLAPEAVSAEAIAEKAAQVRKNFAEPQVADTPEKLEQWMRDQGYLPPLADEVIAKGSQNPTEAPPPSPTPVAPETDELQRLQNLLKPDEPAAPAGSINPMAPVTRVTKTVWNQMEVAHEPTATTPQIRRDANGDLWAWQSSGKRVEMRRFTPEASAPAPTEAVNPMAPPKAKRAPDFKESGNYNVKIGDTTYQIFRDPETKWWYVDDLPGAKQTHYTERVLSTENQKDAIAQLVKNHEHAAAKAAAAEPPKPTVNPTPLQKLAKSGSVDRMDLESELNHYSEEERKAIAELEGFADPNPPAMAEALKNKYGITKATDSASSGGASKYDQKESVVDVLRKNRPEDIAASSSINESTGMRKRQRGSELGSVTEDMRMALGRAFFSSVGGGTIGALTDDKGDHSNMVAGMVGGFLVGFFGPMAIRAAIKDTKEQPTQFIRPLSQIDRSTTVGTVKRTLPELIAQAHLNVGRGPDSSSFLDKGLVKLDEYFGTTIGPKFHRMLEQSAGSARYFTNNIERSLKSIAFLKPDAEAKALTNEFLNGGDKAEYLSKMGNNPDRKAFADFAIDARDNLDGLIEVASRGQGDAARTQMMLDSRGQYLTRQFRAFTDSSYQASDEAINALSQKILKEGTWGTDNLDQIQKGLRDWGEAVRKTKRLYSPSEGSKIDQTLFKHRQVLDAEWKQFLGEITNPIDRVRLTTLKLQPMAKSSSFLHTVATGLTKSDEGLPLSYNSYPEVQAMQQRVMQQLQNAPSDPTLRRQLLELHQYKYVPRDPANGELQGMFVHRHVSDVVSAWGDHMKPDSAFSRTMLGVNSFMKANVTYRNPMSIVRQVVSSPFFLTIGRGWSHVKPAFDALRDPSSPEYRELVENGITHADQVTRDVLREADNISGGLASVPSEGGIQAYLGRVDSQIGDLGTRLKYADNKMADWFKYPDTLVRVSTYMAAKARIAAELGAAMDSTEVINRATEFTNRYTMNYNMLPKAVMAGRAVPFMNLFISYASEMGRILKNLGQDLVAGDAASRLNAAASLGFAIALPEVMQKMSEANLSEKDKKDWEKVKAGLPVYMKDRYMVVTGRDAKGRFQFYDFNNWLPADQFQQTARALLEGRPMDALKNNPVVGWDNNPALNTAASWITHEDRFTGRKLRGPTDYFASGAKEVLGPWTPGVGSQWRNAEAALTGSVDKRGKSVTGMDFWLPIATQIKSGHLDLSVIQQNAVSDYKNNVATEMAYYNDIAKMQNVSLEQKQRAAARTKLALRTLRNQLAVKLGLPPISEQ